MHFKGMQLTHRPPLEGILACLDGYMNIAMEQTEVGIQSISATRPTADLSEQQQYGLQEYVNGQLKNKYGDAFIRGNNGARHTTSCKRAHALTHLCLQFCTSARFKRDSQGR
jgi:small nuclear ribonucleoprotein (snRNP)-like protein